MKLILFVIILAYYGGNICYSINPSKFSSQNRPLNGGIHRDSTGEFYEMLGVSPSASTREIKAAYRERAMTMHPDKGICSSLPPQLINHLHAGGDTEQFKQLNEAYETLVDPQKRSLYDRIGWAAFKQSGGGPSSSPSDFADDPFTSDLARELFSRFRGFSRFSTPGASFVSTPVILRLDLTLEEILQGKNVSIDLNQILRGMRMKAAKSIIDVEIPAGIPDGSNVVVKGIEVIVGGMAVQKDVVLQVYELPHSHFQRLHEHLYLELNISLHEYFFGIDSKEFQFLNGSKIVISSNSINSGRTNSVLSLKDYYCLSGAGFPVFQSTSKRGNLYLKFSVSLPNELPIMNEEDRSQLSNLLRRLERNPLTAGATQASSQNHHKPCVVTKIGSAELPFHVSKSQREGPSSRMFGFDQSAHQQSEFFDDGMPDPLMRFFFGG